MSPRVSPTERLHAEIDEVFASSGDLSEAVEQVARLGARLVLQTAIEAEVTVFLGRDRYARAALADDARPGMRNGYCDTTVKTTAGPVTLQRPKLRGTTERFASQLFGTGVTRTNSLEALVIAGFVRGLSTRDVEAALAEALGPQATLGKSTVSRVCAELKDQFGAWQRRRLDDVELDYLFLDASFFRYHANASAEPVLAAWGIGTQGKPVFVGLDAAAGESGDARAGFLADLGERGLACPLLVISDGAAGLISAAETSMPGAMRQRCLIHRSRKESTCCVEGRGVWRGCRGGHQVAAGAVAGWRRRGDMPGLVEERKGFADGVTDGGPADIQETGQHVHGAQAPLVEDGQQDALPVADLLMEDAAAGIGLAGAAAPLIAEALGPGGLQRCELPGEVMQLAPGQPGQRRAG